MEIFNLSKENTYWSHWIRPISISIRALALIMECYVFYFIILCYVKFANGEVQFWLNPQFEVWGNCERADGICNDTGTWRENIFKNNPSSCHPLERFTIYIWFFFFSYLKTGTLITITTTFCSLPWRMIKTLRKVSSIEKCNMPLLLIFSMQF